MSARKKSTRKTTKHKHTDCIHYSGVDTLSGNTVVYMSEFKDGKYWRLEEIGSHRTEGPMSPKIKKLYDRT